MENKKLSLAALKAKANKVTTTDALNAIKGGGDVVCHDGSCTPNKGKIMGSISINTGG